MKEIVPTNTSPALVSLAQLQTITQPFNLLKSNIGWFANPSDAIARTGLQPVDGPYKPWRDNAFLWNPDKTHAYYLFVAKDSPIDLSIGANFQEPWRSSFTAQVLGAGVVNFLATNKAAIGKIPQFVWMKYRAADAARLSVPSNFGPNDANYPVGELRPWDGASPYFEIIEPETRETIRVQSDWNSLTFLRYDDNGNVVVEFTKDFVPAPFSGAGKKFSLTDDEVVGAVGGILVSGESNKTKAAAIRKIAVS